jgi:predicted enzyme related to lactoylglutathione lyase
MEKCGGRPLAAGARAAVVMWDLNARDAPTLRHFYAELFEWEVSDPSSDRVKLAMVTCGEGGIHGVIGQAPREDEGDFGQRHAGLIVYIKVDDAWKSLPTRHSCPRWATRFSITRPAGHRCSSWGLTISPRRLSAAGMDRSRSTSVSPSRMCRRSWTVCRPTGFALREMF